MITFYYDLPPCHCHDQDPPLCSLAAAMPYAGLPHAILPCLHICICALGCACRPTFVPIPQQQFLPLLFSSVVLPPWDSLTTYMPPTCLWDTIYPYTLLTHIPPTSHYTHPLPCVIPWDYLLFWTLLPMSPNLVLPPTWDGFNPYLPTPLPGPLVWPFHPSSVSPFLYLGIILCNTVCPSFHLLNLPPAQLSPCPGHLPATMGPACLPPCHMDYLPNLPHCLVL